MPTSEQVTGAAGLASASLLVTGAAGGIGSAARTAFLAAGADVTGFDLDDAWATPLDTEQPGALRTVRGDVTNTEVIDINLTGTWLTCKHATPALRASGGGTILCLASTTALHPRRNLGAYCASKAGVGMLVQVLGREVASEGIRGVGVCPTGVETPLFADMIEGLRGGAPSADPDAGLMASKPVQRWLTAREVADALVWLTSPAASAVTGSNIPIDFASV